MRSEATFDTFEEAYYAIVAFDMRGPTRTYMAQREAEAYVVVALRHH